MKHQQSDNKSSLDSEESAVKDNMTKQRSQQANKAIASGFRQLIEACKRKDLDSIRCMLAERPELANHRDKQNRSLLHYAVVMMLDEDQQQQSLRRMSKGELERCVECFDYLADRCDIKLWWHQDADGLSVLHMAVISSNVPMVEHIIYEHPYALKYPLVCAKDREHHSPLHWAVITNNLDSVKLLINYAGTKLAHDPDFNGATPLHYATQTNDYPRYRQQLRSMLRSVGASTGAASGRSSDSETTNNLQISGSQDSGLKTSPQTRFVGSSATVAAATAAAAKAQQDLHQHRSLEILEYLVRLPQINLECADRDHRTPLLWAASSGNRDAIETLLEHGANVASCDANRLSALHCAASHGYTDCLEGIFSSSLASKLALDVNQVDNLNCTPLFYCVLSGNVDCVETLLERGADRDWQDSKGRTAAHFAALKGQLGALKLLQERGANLWLANKQGDLPLHYAIKSGRLQVVRWLLERSPYERAVNAINNFGRAPIHLAVMRNNTPLVDYLVRCGANLNQLVKIRNRRGAAAARRQPEDVDPPGQRQPPVYQYETALDMAKSLGHSGCLQLLERNNAQPAAQVINSRQMAALPVAGADLSSQSRSLFDIQSVEGPSPIGFETSCSSASPNTGAAGSVPKAVAQSAGGGQVPKLRRPAPDELPCTDSTGSSALSQNSLTSVRGGFSGPPLTGEALPVPEAAARLPSSSDDCDNCAKSRQCATGGCSAHSATPRPYCGGISYNNDHICASIKCKLYDKQPLPQCTCNGGGQDANAPRGPATKVAARSAPPASRATACCRGQEIVTNVNVYTSPCSHCTHPHRQLGRKCLECLVDQAPVSQQIQTRRDAGGGGDYEATDETTDGASGSDEDDEGSAGIRLPSLMSSSAMPPQQHPSAVPVRLRHLPPSQGHEQHLPVIMSDREQSTSATSNEEQPEAEGGEAAVAADPKVRQLQQSADFECPDEEDEQYHQAMRSGGDGYHKAVPPPSARRTLVSPAFEEPRFDRSQATTMAASRIARADRCMNKQIRSPVAEYIHSPLHHHHQQPEVDSRGAIKRYSGSVRASGGSSFSQRTPDFSRVRPRVNSNRLQPAGDLYPDDEPKGTRSKSMSMLPPETSGSSPHKHAAGAGKSPQPSRSVSRQTIIKTRRLSVDSVELASRVEKAIRKYKQETKLFEELQNLKRSQIRSGRANEALLVKRLVEHLRQDTRDLIGLDTYQGPYTYKSYERFLYDQLRKLSQSNCAKLSRHHPPYLQDSWHHDADTDGAEPNYLDEDLKAEIELRRIIGDDGEGATVKHKNDDSDTESYVLEPSGALEDIRVRRSSDAAREEPDVGAAQTLAESMRIVHQASADEDTEPLASTQEDNLKAAQQRRESSGAAEQEAGREEAEIIADNIENEAKTMSSAIITDALGNVSRASSLADINKLEAATEEQDVGSERRPSSDDEVKLADASAEAINESQVDSLKASGDEIEATDEQDGTAALEATATDDALSSSVCEPSRGIRRRSIVNIGNKMEEVYHDVGIEINPAPDSDLEDKDDDGEKPKTREDSGEEEEDAAVIERKGPLNRLEDVVEEEEQVADRMKGSAEREAVVAEAAAGPTTEAEADKPAGDAEESSATPTTDAGSRRSSVTGGRRQVGGASEGSRRGSSPASTTSRADSIRKSPRRDPARWSGGSSFSDATFGPGGAQLTKSRVFNGHDLDELHRERSRSRGTLARMGQEPDVRPDGDHFEKANEVRQTGVEFSENIEPTEEIGDATPNDQQLADCESSNLKAVAASLEGDAEDDLQPGKASKRPITKRRLVRSQIPSAKYIPRVPLDEIRMRWSRIKSKERAKLKQAINITDDVEFIGHRSPLPMITGDEDGSSEDGSAAIATAQSQLASYSSGNYTRADDGPNYTLLYEINESMKGLTSAGAEPDVSIATTAKGAKKSRKWCSKMAAHIVDVRTVKRTLSLPETVMYSNNLLKRFNILKL